MKKKILLLGLISIMLLGLCSCSEESKYIGFWRINSINAGQLTMSQSDIDDMGLNAGSIRLNRSGSAELDLLGDEFEGKWKLKKNGNVKIYYGDNLEGDIYKTKKGIKFVDAQGSVYRASK